MRETTVIDQPQLSTAARDAPRRQVLDQVIEHGNLDSPRSTTGRRNSGSDHVNRSDLADTEEQACMKQAASASELVATKQVLVTINPPKCTRTYSNVSL